MLNTLFQFLAFARFNPSAPTVQSGQPAELQCDALGNLNVNIAGYGGTLAPQWADPLQLGYQGVAKNAAGKLGTIYGSNEASTGKVWLMVFDKATYAVQGDVPKFQIPLAAGQDRLWLLRQPRPFANGIVWGVSSTPGVYTPATTAVVWTNFEFT
jgi:hypothetical protein